MDIIKWILFILCFLIPLIWCGMYCNNDDKTFVKNGALIVSAIIIALSVFYILVKKKILSL